MLEVHNVFNVVICNARVFSDRFRSESCHKNKLVCWKLIMFLMWQWKVLGFLVTDSKVKVATKNKLVCLEFHKDLLIW